MSGAEETKPSTSVAENRVDDRSHAERFGPTVWSALQARRIKLWLTLVGKGLLRLNIEIQGLELVPRGEPLIVAAAPHRNWIDPFLILQALPPLPRTYFLAADTPGNRWWKRILINLAGGMVPVSTKGQFNRDGLALALGSCSTGIASGSSRKAGDLNPILRSCLSSAVWPSSASTPGAGCSRLPLPATRTSGAARRYGYKSHLRATRLLQEPIAMRSRFSSMVCARCCKTLCPRSRKSQQTERSRGDG